MKFIILVFLLFLSAFKLNAQNTNPAKSENLSQDNPSAKENNIPNNTASPANNDNLSDSLSYPPNRKSYLLDESFKRLKSVKEDMINGQTNISELKLIFSHSKNDYLIFYDLDGRFAYFRYRQDKFDQENIRKYSKLIKGFPYLIKVKALGIFLNEKKILINNSNFLEKIKNSNSILLFKIYEFKNLRLKSIRF